MNPRTLVIAVLAVLPNIAYAGSTLEQKATGQQQLEDCLKLAQKVSKIIDQSMKTKTYDAGPQVLANSLPNTQERTNLMDIFAPSSTLNIVLVHQAAYAADLAANKAGPAIREKIKSMGYTHILNQCIVHHLSQPQ